MKRLIMLLNHLESFQAKVEAKIKELDQELQEFVEFPCGVNVIPGDGVCLVDLQSSTQAPNVAPLADCIDRINQEGKLSKESFNQLTI